MADRELNINIPVSPVLDRKAANDLRRDLSQLMRSIEQIDNNLGGKTIKSAAATAKQLKNISNSAADFSYALSTGANETLKKFGNLSKEIKKTAQEVERYKQELTTLGDDSPEKVELESKISKTTSKLIELSKSANEQIKANKKLINSTKKREKEEIKNLKRAKQMAGFGKMEAARGIGASLKRGGIGGIEGIAGVIGETYLAGRARKALSLKKLSKKQKKAGDVAGSASSAAAAGEIIASLGPTGLAIAGAVAAIGGLAYGAVKASQFITGLNKSLTEGIPTASDATYSTGNYTKALDEMRLSLIQNEEQINMLGGTLEESAKGFNAFATGVGGMMKGYNLVEQMDGGMQAFQTNLIVYGKSLGMTTQEVGTKLASFYTDYGYGARATNEMFVSLIDTARAANMPINKFMNIFDETIPGLSLYTNRMEELTNVMRMLSKQMSPDAVRQFMQALGKGFKGKGPMERLHDILIADARGPVMKKALGEDFAGKIIDLTKDMGPELSKRFRDAFGKGDETEFLRAINEAKTMPSIPPAKLGDLTEIFYAERMRKKGDPLSLATAAKAGSMVTLIKNIMGKARLLPGTEGGRFEQISEIAAQRLGISPEEQEAYNRFMTTMNTNLRAVKDYATTVSPALDRALAAQIANRIGKSPLDLTVDEFQSATQEDMIKALAYHEDNLKKMDDDKEIQKLIRDKTTSIDEKISQVIARLLHKISENIQNILDKLTSWFSWSTSDDKSEKRYLPQIEQLRDQYLSQSEADIKKKGSLSKDQFALLAKEATYLATQGKERDFLGRSSEMRELGNRLFGDQLITKDITDDVLRSVGINPDQQVAIEGTERPLRGLADIRSGGPETTITKYKTFGEMIRSGDISHASPQELVRLGMIPGLKLQNSLYSRDTAMPVEKLPPVPGKEDVVRDLVGHLEKYKKTGKSPSFTGTTTPSSPEGKALDAAEETTINTADTVHRTNEISKNTEDTQNLLHSGAVNHLKGVAKLMGKDANGYFTAMRDAVREGVEPPLYDLAIFLAKIQESPEAAKLGTVKNLPNIGLGGLAGFNMNYQSFEDAFRQMTGQLPQFADGGVMPHTGLAMLHAGEIITNPAKGQRVGSTNVVINLPFMSNASPNDVARAVAGAMYRIYNQK